MTDKMDHGYLLIMSFPIICLVSKEFFHKYFMVGLSLILQYSVHQKH